MSNHLYTPGQCKGVPLIIYFRLAVFLAATFFFAAGFLAGAGFFFDAAGSNLAGSDTLGWMLGEVFGFGA